MWVHIDDRILLNLDNIIRIYIRIPQYKGPHEAYLVAETVVSTSDGELMERFIAEGTKEHCRERYEGLLNCLIKKQNNLYV